MSMRAMPTGVLGDFTQSTRPGEWSDRIGKVMLFGVDIPEQGLGRMEARRIAFLGTSRSGLGHLRRIATIARALRAKVPQARSVLITNAPPDGLSQEDRSGFCQTVICGRADMSGRLATGGFDMAVLDTLQLPGIGAFRGPAVLILRQTPDAGLADFGRDDGRPWDRVILPNPAEHWVPRATGQFAHSIEAAGWVVRPTGVRQPDDSSAGIVVATGGGGNADTRGRLYPLLDRVIGEARQRASHPLRVRQALGPRAGAAALEQADEIFDPGARLNDVFRRADLVISTAGYNSVLELASTDTPALLASIPRSLDDQAERVRLWGPKLGCALDPADPAKASAWLAAMADRPARRAPVDLGPDGAERAAELLLEVLCPVS